MELTIRNTANISPNRLQNLVYACLGTFILIFGLLGQNGAGLSRLVHLLCAIKEPGEGQAIPGDLTLVREATELMQFLLDTLF